MLRGSSYDDFMSWLNQNEQVNQVIRAETDKTDEDEDDKDTVSDFGSVE